MKTFLIATLLGASALAVSAQNITLGWDASPPEDGPVTYAIESRTESAPSWVVLYEDLTAPIITLTSIRSERTEFRLKITGESGLSVYDPAIVADRPTADLNFRIVAPPSASIERQPGPQRMASNDAEEPPLVVAFLDRWRATESFSVNSPVLTSRVFLE